MRVQKFNEMFTLYNILFDYSIRVRILIYHTIIIISYHATAFTS